MAIDWLQEVGGWGAAAVGLGGSAALLRQRLSRDSTQRAKDRAEAEFVSLLLKERDDARDAARVAWDKRNEDAQTIARLTSQNQYQAEDIARLMEEMESFRRRLARMYPETREFVETTFAQPVPER